MRDRTGVALCIALGAIGPAFVTGGWIWAGAPEGSTDTLCCVLVHLVALADLLIATLLWRGFAGVDGG